MGKLTSVIPPKNKRNSKVGSKYRGVYYRIMERN